MQNDEFKILGASGALDSGDHFLVSLDSILDTRLGTLGKIDVALAANALENGYHSRFLDKFEGISVEDFKKAYKERDIDTLKMSVVTNVSFLFRKIIKDSLAIAVQQNKIARINIDVNVWPYTLESQNQIDMLIACVRAHAYANAVVRIISCPPKALKPSIVREQYQLVIMYDWLEWIDSHREYFEKRGVPEVTLFAPQLFAERPPTPEEHHRFGDGENGDVFRITERIFAPLIRLKLMPVSLFSMIEEIDKSTAKHRLLNVLPSAEALAEAVEHVSGIKPDIAAKEAHPINLQEIDEDELL